MAHLYLQSRSGLFGGSAEAKSLGGFEDFEDQMPPPSTTDHWIIKKDPSLPIHYGTLRTPHYEHHNEHYEQCLPFFSSSSSYPHSTTRLLLPSPRCESGHNSPSLNQKTKITPKTGVGDEGKLHSSWHCTTSTTNTMVSTMKSSPTPHFKPRFTTASATRVSPW